MNLAWALRRALLDCNVVRQNNTTSALLTQPELISWAQDAVRELEALQRKSKEDQNLVTLASDGSTAIILGESYAPSDFQMLTTTLDYTLPPDLIQIKRIRATTAQYKHYIFTPRDINDPVFRNLNQQWTSTTNPTGSEIYYDIIGRRTLHLSHTMPATAEIEIMYIARLPNLYIYDTPTTANMTQDSTAVVVASGNMLIKRLTLPAVLLLASDGGTVDPKIVTQTAADPVVLPNAELEYPVESITDDTNLVLEAVFPGTTDTAVAGIIAPAGAMFDDHYHLIVNYVRHMIYEKVGNLEAAQLQYSLYVQGKKNYEYDIVQRTQGVTFVQDWEG